MSVSKRYVANPKNAEAVLKTYCGRKKPTIKETAVILGTTFHNVHWILHEHLDPKKLKAEQALRYSKSMMRENPMRGLVGAKHHNYKGEVADGHGYLQTKINGRYVLVHRHVLAEALGLEILPSWFDVHHIDEDKQNNDITNLALVTPEGHSALHRKIPRSEKLPLWEQYQSGTLRSPKRTLTRRKVS